MTLSYVMNPSMPLHPELRHNICDALAPAVRYQSVTEAEFVSRPNRFVAAVLLDGEEIKVHVKNTGRCRELLVPGARVVLSDSKDTKRKYRYDLIAMYKGDLLVNMDSQAPNRVFAEWARTCGLFGTNPRIRPESTHGDSRFDFLIESDEGATYVEVKGVTLEENGFCRFPDAPTERGLKHLKGLQRCVEEGYGACVAFVVQMPGMRAFGPNYDTDPDFSSELERAASNGVRILVLGCETTEDSLGIAYDIPVEFGHS